MEALRRRKVKKSQVERIFKAMTAIMKSTNDINQSEFYDKQSLRGLPTYN